MLLAQIVLPTDILTRFTITKVESNENDIRIYLDEPADEEYLSDILIGSKGFTAPSTVRDFPIRDKGVDLIVRRRKYYNNLLTEASLFLLMGLKLKVSATRRNLHFFKRGVWRPSLRPPVRLKITTI